MGSIWNQGLGIVKSVGVGVGDWVWREVKVSGLNWKGGKRVFVSTFLFVFVFVVKKWVWVLGVLDCGAHFGVGEFKVCCHGQMSSVRF